MSINVQLCLSRIGLLFVRFTRCVFFRTFDQEFKDRGRAEGERLLLHTLP